MSVIIFLPTTVFFTLYRPHHIFFHYFTSYTPSLDLIRWILYTVGLASFHAISVNGLSASHYCVFSRVLKTLHSGTYCWLSASLHVFSTMHRSLTFKSVSLATFNTRGAHSLGTTNYMVTCSLNDPFSTRNYSHWAHIAIKGGLSCSASSHLDQSSNFK